MAELKSKIQLNYNEASDVMKSFKNWNEDTKANFFDKLWASLEAAEMSGDQKVVTDKLMETVKPFIAKVMDKSEEICGNIMTILAESGALSQEDATKLAAELAESGKASVKEATKLKRSL